METALAWRDFKPPPPVCFEQAGLHYEVRLIRDLLSLGRDTLPVYHHVPPPTTAEQILADGEQDEDDAELDALFDADGEKYERYLKKLDPTETKEQDHYKVLGLSRLRWKATDEQVRLAYRRKVLKHHPDKRRARGVAVLAESEDYFTCITKAYEQIAVDVNKRRSYDSVDPQFSDALPAAGAVDAANFFDVLTDVFEQNSRWSENQPVPSLGDETMSRERVDAFYSFWFDFQSWREFSYLDDDDKEKGENRMERRWLDKENKVERQQKRKAEVRRIRQLVELAYEKDPRVARFKEEEKQKKQQYKEAKRAEREKIRKQEEEERRQVEDAEQKAKEASEAETRRAQEADKKSKDLRRKQLQTERKLLREFLKTNNFFTDDDAVRFQRMEQLSCLTECLQLEQLKTLNAAIRSPNGQSSEQIFQKCVDDMHEQLEQKSAELHQQQSRSKNADGTQNKTGGVTWTAEENQLLVKATTLFPVGTKSRWDVIAEFINEHHTNGQKRKTGRDVINRVKDFQSMDSSTKEMTTKEGAFSNFMDGGKKAAGGAAGGGAAGVPDAEAIPSERFDALDVRGWTAEEQRLLEQALRTYPASTTDRWDRIAECLPGRTKKECVKRFKELAELIKAKKAAQQSVAAKR